MPIEKMLFEKILLLTIWDCRDNASETIFISNIHNRIYIPITIDIITMLSHETGIS
jgi:hypothetical protein